jgi:subtilisin family serine protease
MIKVIVTKYLNVRVGSPSLNAPCYQYLAPGSELEVDGNLYKGDLFEGVDTWLKDAAGNYYWSDGVRNDLDFGGVDYKDFFKNIDIIKNQGQGVTIVIIDNGINVDPGFFDTARVQNVNIDNGPIVSDHGYFIAGIIAGKKNVIGIAPKANIISLKYKSDATSLKDILGNMVKALNFAVNINGPVVVNVSQGFSDFILDNNPNEKAQIIDSVQKIISQKNKFIVCSGGDNGLITDNVLFPAEMNECISVGCFNEFHKDIPVSSKLKIVSPLVEFTSYGLNFKPKTDVGSSYATAAISAIVASIVSDGQKNGTVLKTADILTKLKQFSVDKKLFAFDRMESFQFQNT